MCTRWHQHATIQLQHHSLFKAFFLWKSSRWFVIVKKRSYADMAHKETWKRVAIALVCCSWYIFVLIMCYYLVLEHECKTYDFVCDTF